MKYLSLNKSGVKGNSRFLVVALGGLLSAGLLSIAGPYFTVVIEAGKVPAVDGNKSTARRATLFALTPVIR